MERLKKGDRVCIGPHTSGCQEAKHGTITEYQNDGCVWVLYDEGAGSKEPISQGFMIKISNNSLKQRLRRLYEEPSE